MREEEIDAVKGRTKDREGKGKQKIGMKERIRRRKEEKKGEDEEGEK